MSTETKTSLSETATAVEDAPAAERQPAAPAEKATEAPANRAQSIAPEAVEPPSQPAPNKEKLRAEMPPVSHAPMHDGSKKFGPESYNNIKNTYNALKGHSPTAGIPGSHTSQSFVAPVASYPIDSEIVRIWVQCLKEHRIVLLQSEASPVLTSAAVAILKAAGLSRDDQRTWSFDDPDGDAINVFSSVRRRLDLEKGPSEGALSLVVYANNTKAQAFLDNLPADPSAQLRGALEKKNAWMIVLCIPELLPKRFEYTQEPIEWLEPIIEGVYQQNGALYIKQIRSLPASKHWNWDWLDTLNWAKQGKLPQKIEECLEGRQSSISQSELEDSPPLHNVVRFVTGYFGGKTEAEPLSPEDFQRVLRCLLADQTIEETVSAISDEGKEIPKRVERKLIDQWASHNYQIAAKCGVSIFREDDGAAYLDFKDPELRRSVVKDFETLYVWTFEDLSQRVHVASLLSDSKRSVRRGVIKLILHRIITDPRGYGRSFLMELTGAMPPPFSKETKNGLEELIDSLVARDLLEPVQASLNGMMDARRHYEAWLLALRLGISPKSRSLLPPLFRRAFDEGTDDLRTEAGMRVLEWIGLMSPAFAPLLADILSWGLEPETEENCASRSFAYDIAVILVAGVLLPESPSRVAFLSEFSSVWLENFCRLLLSEELDERMKKSLSQGEPEGRSKLALLIIMTEWILGMELGTASSRITTNAVAYKCFEELDPFVPYDPSSRDVGDILRVVAITEWARASAEVSEAESAAVKALSSLVLEKRRRKDLRGWLEVISETVITVRHVVDFQSWNSSEERIARVELGDRLRSIRGAARTARAALSA